MPSWNFHINSSEPDNLDKNISEALCPYFDSFHDFRIPYWSRIEGEIHEIACFTFKIEKLVKGGLEKLNASGKFIERSMMLFYIAHHFMLDVIFNYIFPKTGELKTRNNLLKIVEREGFAGLFRYAKRYTEDYGNLDQEIYEDMCEVLSIILDFPVNCSHQNMSYQVVLDHVKSLMSKWGTWVLKFKLKVHDDYIRRVLND